MSSNCLGSFELTPFIHADQLACRSHRTQNWLSVKTAAQQPHPTIRSTNSVWMLIYRRVPQPQLTGVEQYRGIGAARVCRQQFQCGAKQRVVINASYVLDCLSPAALIMDGQARFAVICRDSLGGQHQAHGQSLGVTAGFEESSRQHGVLITKGGAMWHMGRSVAQDHQQSRRGNAALAQRPKQTGPSMSHASLGHAAAFPQTHLVFFSSINKCRFGRPPTQRSACSTANAHPLAFQRQIVCNHLRR
jgi:hypothetical protein